MLQIHAAEGCPYAQRSRAILAHLKTPFELHVVDLRNKTPEFLALSPTGRVPLLVDGDAKLYESSVIDEYLREREGWDAGFSRDVYQRARERLAMLQFDNVLTPAFWKALRGETLDEAKRQGIERELDELARTVAAADSRVNLLAFHTITHVVRWRWFGEATPLPAMIAARPALSAWFDEIAALPAVVSTLPDRDATIAALKKYAAA